MKGKSRIPGKGLDLRPLVKKAVERHCHKIVVAAHRKLFPGEGFKPELFTIKREIVEFYPIPILTARYKGIVLYRIFVEDLYGLRFRFESPIYETEKQ